jgi:replicative DNA helicase
MNIDAAFFYCLLRDGDPKPLAATPREWVTKEWWGVYDFVVECMANPQMHHLPKLETVVERCGVQFTHTDEDVGYYIGLLCKRAARLSLEDGITRELLPLLRDPSDMEFNPIAAAEKMLLLCASIQRKYRQRGAAVLDYNRDLAPRVVAYNQRKERGGMIGIPYPFEPMNAATGGMIGGEGTVMLARSGVGKTWLFSRVCNHAVENGYSVLALSQEMRPRELSVRLDALGARVSPERFWRGTLSVEEELRVREYYTSLPQRKGNIYMYGPSDINSFAAFEALLTTMRSKVDLVAWDSPYLVIRSDRWEQRADFCHCLKQTIEDFDIPLFVTWQLNRQNEPALTDAILTDMDQDFVATNENLKQVMQLLISSMKTRTGLELEKLLLKWDLSEGIADVISWRIPGYGDSHASYVVEDV